MRSQPKESGLGNLHSKTGVCVYSILHYKTEEDSVAATFLPQEKGQSHIKNTTNLRFGKACRLWLASVTAPGGMSTT